MNIFIEYCLIFTPVCFCGICFLSWMQLSFLHGHMEKWVPALPKTLLMSAAFIIAILIVVYFILKPFLKAYKEIKEGREPDDQDRVIALKAYKTLYSFSLCACLAGFVCANLIDFLAKVAKGAVEFDFMKVVITVEMAMVYGFMAAQYTVYFLDSAFVKYRKTLKIVNLEKKNSSVPFHIQVLCIVFGTLLFVVINANAMPYNMLKHPENYPDQMRYFTIFSPLVTFASILMSMGPVFVVISGLKKRINQTRIDLDNITNGGDISKRIQILCADDFGLLSSSINQLMESLSQMINGVRQGSTVVENSSENLKSIVEAANSALTKMSLAFNKIKCEENTQNHLVLGVSNEVADLQKGIVDLQNNIILQSQSMQQNSAAITQMVANVNSVAEMAVKADLVSRKLSETSDSGNKMIQLSVDAINEIQKSGEEVQNIIKVIQNIAYQTNLLAMNAAIEAAHAGDVGKGFAVVADEVRTLAASSAKSSKDVQFHINDMVEKINSGVQTISQAGAAFQEITEKVEENTQLMKTISNAMEEQRSGAQKTMKLTAEAAEQLAGLKDLAQKQAQYAERVKNAMDSTVKTSENVRNVVVESISTSANLRGAIKRLDETIGENVDAVQKMNQKMSAFKDSAVETIIQEQKEEVLEAEELTDEVPTVDSFF